MADVTKYAPINGGTLISDFKSYFSPFKTRRSVTLAYTFIFIFIAFTIFLAFSPSSNSSSPWFTNIFATTTPSSSSVSTHQLSGSHFSSIYYYFFPNSSSSSSQSRYSSPTSNAGSPATAFSLRNFTEDPSLQPNNSTSLPSVNQTVSEELKQNQSRIHDKSEESKLNLSRIHDKSEESKQNQSRVHDKSEESKQNQSRLHDKSEELKRNQSSIEVAKSANRTVNSSPKSGSQGKTIAEKTPVKKGSDDLLKSLMKCDMFDGNWVKDDSYPLYKPGSCSLIDEQFNCFQNGRPDNGYHKQKWKPKGCTLPRLDGSHMLEMLRGKRLVFVGDSLNRNMWESLICILRNCVKDKKKVYEEKGRHHFRAEASYSFVFEDYKCTVEFFVAPFIVQESEATEKNGTKKETLRLDLMSRAAEKYKNADIIVFNTGHWWTHEKTSTGKDYYQEGSHVYNDLNVLEAFRKALTTWGRWVDSKVDSKKSLVFFRGYSASHFSGGQWNSGGQCDHETEPIKNETYLKPYPPKMSVLERVMKGMKTPATYLNITRMTDYRKDGHPSIYRKLHMTQQERRSPLHIQDCSHWCLPGVPDAWNEILYAQLLLKLNHNRA
ncbi:hypothetical protein ACS0TY_034509 [Phlomoides rotata]